MLKILKLVFNGVTGGFFTNTSNAFLLLVGVSGTPTGPTATLSLVDEYGGDVADIIRIQQISLPNESVSGTNTFSSTAATTTGIASTSESVSETVSGVSDAELVVINRVIIPPNFGLSSYSYTVSGLLLIQADSLEELRGFL